MFQAASSYYVHFCCRFPVNVVLNFSVVFSYWCRVLLIMSFFHLVSETNRTRHQPTFNTTETEKNPKILWFHQNPIKGLGKIKKINNGGVWVSWGNTPQLHPQLRGSCPTQRCLSPRPLSRHLGLDLSSVSQSHQPNGVVSHLPLKLGLRPVEDWYGHSFWYQELGLPRGH